MIYKRLRQTNLEIPPIIFGTSCLGNLYQALADETKHAIVSEMFNHMPGPVVMDTAGKYGAGLALEVIGDCLHRLNIRQNDISLSNKLGWYRVALTTDEPTFEPGVWADLQYDAVQKISYDGILACWEQGKELLGDGYQMQMVSVHDPDEYLAAAQIPAQSEKAFSDIIQAYRALLQLKNQGETMAVGVGAKDWRVIREIVRHVELDWVMLAISYTIWTHPPALLEFVDELAERNIGVFNSAVFHAGFLTGGKYFDYRIPDPRKNSDKPLFTWREDFTRICRMFDVTPAVACIQFGLSNPGILSIALNTGNPERILKNIQAVEAEIPHQFWVAMKDAGLIDRNYPFLG
ncbi:aldo/keto reductase [candidate division KSB1 bacterium]|nr:aldo/keto reductase [candidate division KSB1 bacterium]